jgi:hypothetical protein
VAVRPAASVTLASEASARHAQPRQLPNSSRTIRLALKPVLSQASAILMSTLCCVLASHDTMHAACHACIFLQGLLVRSFWQLFQ